METQAISFTDKFSHAEQFAASVKASQVTSREEHAAVALKVEEIRTLEKSLEDEYSELPVILEAKRLQGIKCALAAALKDARVTAKKALLAFEDRLEAERLAAERIAQAEARKLAEQAALEAAVEAEASGDTAQAEAIINEPVVAATIVVPEEKLKAKGHTRRRVYRVKITDASRIPDDFLVPDMAKIEATARAWKREGEIIPGVMCYSEVV